MMECGDLFCGLIKVKFDSACPSALKSDLLNTKCHHPLIISLQRESLLKAIYEHSYKWVHNLFCLYLAYMRKTSDVAVMAFFGKKNWRKIWPKNDLKWRKIAKKFCLKMA